MNEFNEPWKFNLDDAPKLAAWLRSLGWVVIDPSQSQAPKLGWGLDETGMTEAALNNRSQGNG